MKYYASNLWNYKNSNDDEIISIEDLKDFKRNAINHKIAVFNPETNGMRYLKTLIYNVVQNQPKQFWDILENIDNRDIGEPVNIVMNGKKVCLDYYQAVSELMFLVPHVSLDDCVILEIGSGYGRTCHAILSNYSVDSYNIVDLDNCLQLSRVYLQRVLPEEDYNKIRFISVKEFENGIDLSVDLTINIDSFAEMTEDVVKAYLNYINDYSKYFYVKNPVAKYLDTSLDNHSQGPEVVKMALSTGILRDIIDIDDSREIEKKARSFVSAYCPSNTWKCVSNKHAPPWSYYWQSLYRLNKND